MSLNSMCCNSKYSP